MEGNALQGIALIIVLGIGVQWISWRFRLPSILLLLLAGILVGPLTNLLNPDHLLGDILFPVVSISVAIILFEGGMSLKIQELVRVGTVVRNLVSIGILVTWILVTFLAWTVLGMSFRLSLLLGAILTVTGPTVVVPLLMQIKPKGNTAAILKWEGIVNDPIGAVLAVLVFEAVRVGSIHLAPAVILVGVFKTILISMLFGITISIGMIMIMKRHWVPDHLENPFTLMGVVGAFYFSNLFQPESGLLTVTLMGIILANQRVVDITRIVEFKENLRTVLISSLFIILAARLKLEHLLQIDWMTLAFLGLLILLVRPLAVLASTVGVGCSTRNKVMLSWMAPRGIVAAAVASSFSLSLQRAGIPGAEQIVTETFFVIIGTVLIYGGTAYPLALKLGIAYPKPQGILVIGAHEWARHLALMVQKEGFRVLLVDSNPLHIEQAIAAGLEAVQANALSPHTTESLDLSGIGRMVALTPNEEVNALACLRHEEIFGRANCYQLVPSHVEGTRRRVETSGVLRGRGLFSPSATHDAIENRLLEGGEFTIFPVQAESDIARMQSFVAAGALPLLVIHDDRELEVLTSDTKPTWREGQRILTLHSSRSQHVRNRKGGLKTAERP